MWLLEDATFAGAAGLLRTERPLVYSGLVVLVFILGTPFTWHGMPAYLWPPLTHLTLHEGCPMQFWHQYAMGVALALFVRQRALDGVAANTWCASAATLALSGVFFNEPSVWFGGW